MQKVLICGPNYFDFTESAKDAFISLGWDTNVEMYDVPIHPFNIRNKILYKLTSNKEKLTVNSRKKYQQHIIKTFDKYNPDLVFVLNGNILEFSTLKYFRSKSKVIIWLFDTIKRSSYTKYLIDYADFFCCYEQSDIDYFKSIGKQATFIPQACDTKIYFPENNTEKDIDILFVGTLYNYKKRISFLKKLVKEFPDKKILIYGIYKPYYKNIFKWIFREHRNIFMNRNIDRQEVSKLYNRSKVVLNIQHETSESSANPKVFEICGSGAYQVCDKNPFIESLFPSGDVGLYETKEEMIEQIRWALEPNNYKLKDAKAINAYKLIIDKHTFKERISLMLEELKNTRK